MNKIHPSLVRTLFLALTITCQSSFSSANAQTTLAQGDLSFLGFSANPTKGFAFVCWVPLQAGTKIVFSENGFNDATKTSDATGNVRWRKPYGIWENNTGATIAAGTVITLVGETENYGTYEIYTVTGATSATVHTMSNSAGGHLFAMQGGTLPNLGADAATYNGTILAALGYQSTSGASSWLSTGPATSGNSMLPSNLSSSNTVFLSGNANVGQYTGLRTGLSAAQYKTEIAGTANWTTAPATGSVTYNTTAFSLSSPVSITTQPSSASICASSNTSFSVVASNATGYQWQVNTGSGFNNITNSAPYSGVTTATLTVTGATAGMNGYSYRCVVSNASGSVNSNNVTLTIYSAPAITASPSNVTVCAGSNTGFSVTAANATGYQWYENSGSGFTVINNGGVFSGATTATLTITGVTNARNGYQYRCVATGSCTPAATSTAATLTVNSAPSITVHPSPSNICAGSSTSFSVSASGATGYQWQMNTGSGFSNLINDANASGGSYSNVTGASLTVSDVTAGMSGYTYRCVVTGSCTPNATSTSASLTVNPLVTYYRDFDQDGYGSPYTTTTSCTGVPFGFVNNSDDCDDQDSTVLPGRSKWIGAVSSNWSDPANWSCFQLPAATSDVLISVTANQPVVDINSAACNDLTIQTGASLQISEGMKLSINGSVFNSGSFTAAGKTTFSGGDQTIPGGTFADLEIAGTGTKTLGGAASLTGILTLSSGKLMLGGYNLTIGGGGSISGGSVTGYIVVDGAGRLKQQNIGAGGRTGSVLFPIGSASSYTPLSINNTGTADEFGAGVIDQVYSTYDANDVPTGAAQSNNNVNKTWLVTEAVPGGSLVTLTLQWNGSDELPGFGRTYAKAAHFKGGYWQSGPVTGASGTDPYTISLAGVNSFSPFGVGSNNSVLPLNLLSFGGKESADGVALQWKTSQEVNTAGFDIERSDNGIDFSVVGTMRAGMNSTYSFIDRTVASGASYFYRLRMRDNDGRFTYSSTIIVALKASSKGFSVYPNPVSGSLMYVKAADACADLKLEVIDVSGKTWSSHRFINVAAGSRLEIPVQQLPQGSYVLRITSDGRVAVQTAKFTVNR